MWTAITLAAAIAATPRGPDFDGDGFEDLAVGLPDEDYGSVVDAGAVYLAYGSATGMVFGSDRTVVLRQGLSDVAGLGPDERFGDALAWGDFNGDCLDDLAVGVPRNDVDGIVGAGVVHVFYGGANGLEVGDSDHLIHRNIAYMDGDPQTGARFGTALAAGDFDGDGLDDLAIGAPGDWRDGHADAGSVHLVYGLAGVGLDATGDRVFDRNDFDGDVGTTDSFGSQLAAGDFDDSGRDDLAIGVSGAAGGGAVALLYGSISGLSTTYRTPTLWAGDLLAGGYDDNDQLGRGGDAAVAMVSADFDNDGAADLAVGVPRMDAVGSNAGGVRILYGSATDGLSLTGNQLLTINQTDLGVATDGDRFGWTLATGRFDLDGYDDLAVGSLVDAGAGAVHILRGGIAGIHTASDRVWRRGQGGIGGQHEAGERFGAGLGPADFDGNGTTDLMVGVPYMGLASEDRCGALFTVFTDPQNVPEILTVESWIQEDIGPLESSEARDQLGTVFASARKIGVCDVSHPGDLQIAP